jgi:TrmH family RNA methyltransferase
MLNFGMHDLRLVQPRCDHLSENARALAAGSVEVLENARVFDTLEECIADLQQVIATTARPRKMTQMIYSPESAARVSLTAGNERATGLLFGRERSGLTNDEVAMADSIINIPRFLLLFFLFFSLSLFLSLFLSFLV